MRLKRLFTLSILLSMLLSVCQVGPTSASGLPTSEPASVMAHKFEDANENGVQDEGEADLEGWLFRLYQLDGGIEQVAEGTTGGDGLVTFDDLPPGRYKVWEELPECWAATTPGGDWNGGHYVVVDLVEGQQAEFKFGNVHTCEPPPAPETCIDLEKAGPETAAPGDTVTYHFLVKNCGDVVLKGGAQVYDPLFGDDPIWDGDLEPVYAEPRPHERMVDRDPPSPIVDISKAERLIGYKPRVTVYDGLQKYVEWFRKKRDVSERCKS